MGENEFWCASDSKADWLRIARDVSILRAVSKLYLTGLLGVVVAGLLAIVQNSQPLTVLAIGLALATIEVMVLATAAGGFSPVVIPVLVVNSVLLSSLVLWDRARVETSYGITLEVPSEYLTQAALIGILFCVAYTLGALLAGPRKVQISLSQIGKTVAELGSSLRVPNGVLVGVGYAGIVLMIYAYQGALLRGQYLEAHGPHWAAILSNAFAPVAVLALSMAASRPGPWRMLAFLGIALWLVILFGRASRSVATLPTLVVVGRALASGWRIRMRSLVTAAVPTVLLMHLALINRSNPDGVGIIPLGARLFTKPGELLSGFSLNATLGNVWVSGPLTAVVAHRPIPSEAFWISVNPMPGALAGWNQIQGSLRLNLYTPYNALGELGAHGWVALVAVAGAAGFAFSLSTRMASNLKGAYGMAAMIYVLAIVALFSIILLEYNLRSTVRLVWYALFGVAAIWFVDTSFRRQRAALEVHVAPSSSIVPASALTIAPSTPSR